MRKICGTDSPYLNQYFGTISAALVMLSSSLGLGWYPPIMAKLPEIYNISEQKVIALSQIFQIGSFIGIIVCGVISTKLGRKTGMFIVAIPNAIGLLLLIFINETYALYINRVLAGFSFAGAGTIVPAFSCEISSPKIRGVLSGTVSVMLQFSILLECVLVPLLSYKINLIVCLSITVIGWLAVTQIPESPYWLISDGKLSEAEKSLKYYRNSNNVDSEFLTMTLAIEKEKEEEGTYWDLIKITTNRKALLIIFFVFLVQQFTACGVILQYFQNILEHSGTTLPTDVAGIITSGANFTFALLFCPLSDIFGRKAAVITSCICLPIPLVGLGLFFYFKTNGTGSFYTDMQFAPLVCLILIVLIQSIGLLSTPFTYMSELFPTNVRAMAGAVICLYSTALGTVSLKIYEAMTTDAAYGFDMFFFTVAVISIVLAILSWFIILETKGLSLEEIQKKLKMS